MSASQQVTEEAAEAAFRAFQHDVVPEGRATWEQVPEEMRDTFRKVADAVLSVPLLRLFDAAMAPPSPEGESSDE